LALFGLAYLDIAAFINSAQASVQQIDDRKEEIRRKGKKTSYNR